MKQSLLALLGFFLIIPPAGYGLSLSSSQDELLEADQAFALSTRVLDADTLEARWEIAEGYYLYRDKFKFEVMDGDIGLRAPGIPAGKRKQDPLFGEVEIFTKSVAVRLPITRRNTTAHGATLRITSQGCNEPVGVCYPPSIKQVRFDLPAAAASAPGGGIDSLSDLGQLLEPAAGQDEFLHPDEAFQVQVSAADETTLHARFDIADGYYLYRDKTTFKLRGADGSSDLTGTAVGEFKLPEGKHKDDEYFGPMQVYYKQFEVDLPLKDMGGAVTQATLSVRYQGCAEDGICYPPITKAFAINDILGGTPIAGGLGTKGFIFAILGAFGVGLFLSFTPCVLPMIPILSSIIVGQGGATLSKTRGGFLSLSYVLGTAVTYTAAGVLAGATGDQLQAYFQNIWAIGLISVLLVLLALSMFGFYELQMPSFIQSRLQSRTQNVKGGSFVGVFILGLVSALIVGACVSPLLISVLGAAIASKDPLLGGALMFSMAMGMGMILIAIGVGAGFLLPRAGPWMERVKHFFGVLLLAVAIYLLGILPQVPVLFLWAALLIVTSVYFGATQPLSEGASGWRYFYKGIGTVMLIWGVLAMIGGFSGNRDILRPLPLSAGNFMGASLAPSATATPTTTNHAFERVATLAELEQRLATARAAGKPVLLDYFATWCTDCVRMEKVTFSHPQVQELMRSRFVALQVDVTDASDPQSRAIKQRFGVFGPPAMLFFAADGSERKDLHFYGFKRVDEFLQILGRV